jgi:hypothetical protein
MVARFLAHHSPPVLPLENNQINSSKKKRATCQRRKQMCKKEKEGRGGGTTSAKGECGGGNLEKLAQKVCHHVRGVE